MTATSGRGIPRRAVAAGLAACAALTGCSTEWETGRAAAAECASNGPLNSPALVLVAQAVPSATLLPCIRSIPAGWNEREMIVASDRAEFHFSSDREGDRALTVVLTATCDVRGASRVPSDQAGARRYELPTRVTRGYAGSRFYVFPGGCITFRFDVTGTTRAQSVLEASSAVGFTTRDTVRDMVRRHSEGRLRLDDAPGSPR